MLPSGRGQTRAVVQHEGLDPQFAWSFFHETNAHFNPGISTRCLAKSVAKGVFDSGLKQENGQHSISRDLRIEPNAPGHGFVPAKRFQLNVFLKGLQLLCQAMLGRIRIVPMPSPKGNKGPEQLPCLLVTSVGPHPLHR